MSLLELIVDLEIDVACMLDSFDEVTELDLEKLQDKLRKLHDEYLFSTPNP